MKERERAFKYYPLESLPFSCACPGHFPSLDFVLSSRFVLAIGTGITAQKIAMSGSLTMGSTGGATNTSLYPGFPAYVQVLFARPTASLAIDR
jgi:hypothetical protein